MAYFNISENIIQWIILHYLAYKQLINLKLYLKIKFY